MKADRKTNHPYIVCTEGIVGGRPRVKGTGLSVELLARFHKMGESPADMLEMYPNLTPAALYDALSYYYDHQQQFDEGIAELDRIADDPDGYMAKQGFEPVPGGGYRPVAQQ